MIRLFNHYFSTRLLLLTLVEASVLYYSLLLGTAIRIPAGDPAPTANSAAIFTFAMLSIMTALGMYHSQPESLTRTVQRLIVAFLLAMFFSSSVFYVFPFLYVGRGIFAIAALIASVGLLIVRLLSYLQRLCAEAPDSGGRRGRRLHRINRIPEYCSGITNHAVGRLVCNPQ
jgi:FlaA1/EpsC-like NDP-sugar epimerase